MIIEVTQGCTKDSVLIDGKEFIDMSHEEQHKPEGFSYFICATNGEHTNAFSSVDATKQELIAFLASAMRQNKDVEFSIQWVAEHYKQLNKIVQDGIKCN